MSELKPEQYTVEMLVAYVNRKLFPMIGELAQELVEATIENVKLREEIARLKEATARVETSETV